jgi:hypothetical protein
MSRKFALAAVAMTALSLAASSATAHEISVTAILNGASEAPANSSPGTGTASVFLDLDTGLMTVNAQFSGLTGNTTAAHIHGLTAAPLTGTAGVITVTPTFTGFPLGVTSGTYSATFDMTQAASYNSAFITAQGSLANAYNALQLGLTSGRTYLNIHTSTFGGGEIRGFLVPEPATLSLLGGVSLVTLGRRRRNG